MSIHLYLIAHKQQQNYATYAFHFIIPNNSQDLEDNLCCNNNIVYPYCGILGYLLSPNVWLNYSEANSSCRSHFLASLADFLNVGCDNNATPTGWSYTIRPNVLVRCGDINDKNFYEANYAGKSMIIPLMLSYDSTPLNQSLITWRINFTSFSSWVNSNSELYVGDLSTWDYCDPQASNSSFRSHLYFLSSFSDNFHYSTSDLVCGASNCDDLRTSTSTQECLITINGEDGLGNSVSQNYTLMFQPDSQHTSGSLTNIGWLPMTKVSGATCRFTGGVIRGSGIITVRGRINGTVIKGVEQVPGGTLVPVVEPVFEDCILLQASFSPCCDTPDSWSETYTDVLGDVLDGEDVQFLGTLEVTSIEWSGFELLTDYCCDDSDCSDITIEYPPNDTIVDGGGDSGGGDSGGGDSTDITCICENLENLITLLGSKLDFITSAINGLELTTTVEPCSPTITVEPCSPTITVSPAIPSITVSPASPTVTVEPASPAITVSPCTPTVTVNPTDVSGIVSAINGLDLSANITNNIDGLTCEDNLGNSESLACILKNALNYNSESISEIQKKAFSKYDDCCNEEINLVDVFTTEDSNGCDNVTITDLIKNKPMASDIFVTIEPNELLSYRKVFKLDENDN